MDGKGGQSSQCSCGDRGKCLSQGGLAVCKYDGKPKGWQQEGDETGKKKREVVSAARLFALLRRNSSENFCHIVLTQQGATDRRRGEKKRRETVIGGVLFSFSSLLRAVFSLRFCAFTGVCVCVPLCVCVRAHLNLLLITSHTSRLSGGLLTVGDYQAA